MSTPTSAAEAPPTPPGGGGVVGDGRDGHDARLVRDVEGHRLRARGGVDEDGLVARGARQGVGLCPRAWGELGDGVALEEGRGERHFCVAGLDVVEEYCAGVGGEEGEGADGLGVGFSLGQGVREG
jgi:hypothetical protein